MYLLVNCVSFPTMLLGMGETTMAEESYTLAVNGDPGIAMPSYRTSMVWLPGNKIQPHTSNMEEFLCRACHSHWYTLSQLVPKYIHKYICLPDNTNLALKLKKILNKD